MTFVFGYPWGSWGGRGHAVLDPEPGATFGYSLCGRRVQLGQHLPFSSGLSSCKICVRKMEAEVATTL